MSHLTVMRPVQLTNTKTPFVFRRGPGQSLFGHVLEYDDLHRAVRFNGETVVIFTEIEYQLFRLLIEYSLQKRKEVSYAVLMTKVFACDFSPDFLPFVRKRVSALRKKISRFGIDIISIPQRGYELGDLSQVMVPYRRGHRRLLHMLPPSIQAGREMVEHDGEAERY